MTKNLYIAVIGDIVGSRDLKRKRSRVQRNLEETLADLSRRNRHIASPYTVTLGDEFQGLLTSAEGLFGDLFQILAALHPVRMRFGIGVGGLSTPINSKQAIGMDGPVFHAARYSIEMIAGQHQHKQCFWVSAPASDCWRGQDEVTLSLISHCIQDWNANRLHILAGLKTGHSVQELAEQLDISEQAVYKNIRAGGLREVQALLTCLEWNIEAVLNEGNAV